jgi:hypothetical protein
MEITCTRCHQTVEAENCYCPACGLPRLTYSAGDAPGQAQQPEQSIGSVRDAGSVDWKQALRAALLLALPAGLLASGISPVGPLGLVWMAAAAALTVVLYLRRMQTAWVTIGAGARIGLVTGLLAAWLAFGISGGGLFVERFALHRATEIDAEWKDRVGRSQEMTQQWMAGIASSDAAQAQAGRNQVQAFMLSPEGHASIEAFGFVTNAFFMLLFSVAGGALGARYLARGRRSEI